MTVDPSWLVQKFPSEEEARQFMQNDRDGSMILGSRDPMVSCVNVEELTKVKRVFTSAETSGLRTVKVFELKP